MNRKPPLPAIVPPHPREALPGAVETSSPPRAPATNEGHLRVPPELTKSPAKREDEEKKVQGAAAVMRQRTGLRPIPPQVLKNLDHSSNHWQSASTRVPAEVDSAVSSSAIQLQRARNLEEDSSSASRSESDRVEEEQADQPPPQERVERPVPAPQDGVKPSPAPSPAPAPFAHQDSRRLQDMETNFPLPTAEEVKEFCLSCGGGYGEVNAETDEFFVGGVTEQHSIKTRNIVSRVKSAAKNLFERSRVRALSITTGFSGAPLQKNKSFAIPPPPPDNFGVVVVRFNCVVGRPPARCSLAVRLLRVDKTVQISTEEPGAFIWKRVGTGKWHRFPGARSTLVPDTNRGASKMTKDEEEYGGCAIPTREAGSEWVELSDSLEGLLGSQSEQAKHSAKNAPPSSSPGRKRGKRALDDPPHTPVTGSYLGDNGQGGGECRVQVAVQLNLEKKHENGEEHTGWGALINGGLEVKVQVDDEAGQGWVVHEEFPNALWSRFSLEEGGCDERMREVEGKKAGRGGGRGRGRASFQADTANGAGAKGGGGSGGIKGAQLIAFIKPTIQDRDAAFLNACYPTRRKDLFVGAGRLAFEARFQQQASSYVRVSSGADTLPRTKVPSGAEHGYHHTNPHLLRFLAQHVWGLESPQLLITVTGGAVDFQLSVEAKNDLLSGLTDATNHMRAWFIDGGTDAGIMKYMGEARAQYAINTPLIGVASWSAIKGRQNLMKAYERTNATPHDKLEPIVYAKAVKVFSRDLSKKLGELAAEEIEHLRGRGFTWGDDGEHDLKKLMSKPTAALNHNHSHFILVHDGNSCKFGSEVVLRASFEAAIAGGKNTTQPILDKLLEQKLGWQGMNVKAIERAGRKKDKAVPAVCVCVQGGPGTIDTVKYAALNGTPVLLVRGSGKAADLLADATILVNRKKTLTHQRGLVEMGAMTPKRAKLEAVILACDQLYGQHWLSTQGLQRLELDLSKRDEGEEAEEGFLQQLIVDVIQEYGLTPSNRQDRKKKAKFFLLSVLQAACSDRCWVYDLEGDDIDANDLNGALLDSILHCGSMKLKDRLRLSVKWTRADILKTILHEPDIQERRKDNEQALQSALLLALKKDGAEVVKMLLDYGVSLDDLDLNQKHLFTDQFEKWLDRASHPSALRSNRTLQAHMAELEDMDKEHAKEITHALNWRKLLIQCTKHQAAHHVIQLRRNAKTNLEWKSGSWQGVMFKKLLVLLRKIKWMEEQKKGALQPDVAQVKESLKARKSLLVLDRIYFDLLGPPFRYKTGMMSPHWDLFLWAVLMNRHDLALVLWKHTANPTISALTACILYRKMVPHSKVEVQERLHDNAREFEQMAIKLMVNARQEDMPLALKALERPHGLWFGWTAFDLAVEGECRDFVHKCCTQASENRWTGDIDASRSNAERPWLPVAAIVFLNLFALGLFAPWTLQYENAPMSEELRQPAQLRRIPEGYPNKPQNNPILARRKEMWDTEKLRLGAHAAHHAKQDPDSRLSLLGMLGGWGVGSRAQKTVPKDVATMAKLQSNPDLILTMSESEIAHLWSSTLSYSERWLLFIKAPVTLFCWHAIVYTSVVLVFTYEIGKKYTNPPSTIPWPEYTVAIWAACSSVHEGAQLLNTGFGYFKDFWNAIDVMSILLFWSGFSLRLACFDNGHECRYRFIWDRDDKSIAELKALPEESFEEYIDNQMFKNEKGARLDRFALQIYGIACFFFWLRLLHLYSVNRVLGPLVLAIRRMLRDIFTFMFVWLVFLMAFATALNGGNTKGECMDPEETEAIHGFCLDTWWIFRTYFQTFGEMFLDEMSDVFSLVIFMLALLVLQLVLMNTVFVAIITSTFEKVWQDSNREWQIDMYNLINEYISFTAAIPVPLNVLAVVYNLFGYVFYWKFVREQQDKEKVAGLKVSSKRHLHARLRNARYDKLQLLPSELQREYAEWELNKERDTHHNQIDQRGSQVSAFSELPEKERLDMKGGLSSFIVKHVEALMERAKSKYFQEKEAEAKHRDLSRKRMLKVSGQVSALEQAFRGDKQVANNLRAIEANSSDIRHLSLRMERMEGMLETMMADLNRLAHRS